MPEIPRFKPAPTTEEPAPSMAGLQPAISLMRTAREGWVQAAGSIEKGLTDYFQKERKAKLAVKSMEAENAIDEDMDVLDQSFDTRVDYDKFNSDLENSLEKFNKKYSEMAGGDKDLSFAINSYFQKKAGGVRHDVRVKTARVIVEEGMGQLVKKSNELKTEYATSRDPKKREEILTDIENRVKAVVSFNIMNDIQAEQFTQAFKKDIQEGRLINLYKNDPSAAILAIEKGEFPSLNLKELAIYKGAAEEREIVLKDRLEKEQNQKIVDETYKELKSKFPNDYPLMLKRLYDADYQKEKGITGPLSNQVENLLKSEWATTETERTKKHETNGANLFVNLRKTPSGVIDQMVLTDQISWQQGEHFKSERQRTDPVEDDAATYAILLQKALDPTLTEDKRPKIQMEIITSRGLKTETKKTLIKDLLEDQLFKDPWFKRAEKEIKEGLGWTEQMGFFNLKDPSKILKAQTSYRDVTNQLITDIKKEGLRGPDIYKRAKELVLPKQMEVWDMLMGGGKGKEEKPKEKYEIGKIYTDAQGNKAKYIGNGKWDPLKPPK